MNLPPQIVKKEKWECTFALVCEEQIEMRQNTVHCDCHCKA